METALGSVREIEREVAALRIAPGSDVPYQRTSVMTHTAWVPPEWVEAADDVLAGLAERHPSRTIVLVPEPEREDGLEAQVDVEIFPSGEGRQICAETIRTVHMDFLYGGAFRTGLPEAYERLILDAMLGDATLFTRIDEVEEQWALVDAIVAAWARDRPAFPNYAAGTWGPTAADELMERDGRSWRLR